MTIQVSVTLELEQFISQQLAAGHYLSADDVVIEGLQVLREQFQERQQKLAALQRDVDIALEQSKMGQSTVFDDKVADEIKAGGRERIKAKGTPIA